MVTTHPLQNNTIADLLDIFFRSILKMTSDDGKKKEEKEYQKHEAVPAFFSFWESHNDPLAFLTVSFDVYYLPLRHSIGFLITHTQYSS